MKRFLAALLCLCLAVGLLSGSALGAQDLERPVTPLPRTSRGRNFVVLRLYSPQCVIDGKLDQVDRADKGVYPILDNQRTLVPIRRIIEAFGGTVEWKAQEPEYIYLHRITADWTAYWDVTLKLDDPWMSTSLHGSVHLDAAPRAQSGRTYVPLRAPLENMGLFVEYEPTHMLAVVSDRPIGKTGEDLLTIPEVAYLAENANVYLPAPAQGGQREPHYVDQPLKLERDQSYALPSGTLTAHIVTIDPADSRVKFRAALPYGLLNTTAPFSEICAASGAQVVVDANYFQVNRSVKDPVGHVVIDGRFFHGNSGLSTLAAYADGTVKLGRGHFFYRLKTVDAGDYQEWSAFEVNTLAHFAGQSVYYTPARGAGFTVGYPGAVLTLENGVSTGYRTVKTGDYVAIPPQGSVLYSAADVTATGWYQTPQMGRKMDIEPYAFQGQGQTDPLEAAGLVTAVNGSPRLVTDFQADYTLEDGFLPGQFNAGVTRRTAVGLKPDGKVLLVCTPGASIQQMRELMLALGCEDAMCLDGGSSTALYYQGQTVMEPARALSTTLQIFLEG